MGKGAIQSMLKGTRAMSQGQNILLCRSTAPLGSLGPRASTAVRRGSHLSRFESGLIDCGSVADDHGLVPLTWAGLN